MKMVDMIVDIIYRKVNNRIYEKFNINRFENK